ncbi:MAG: VanW family protein [Kouleothrix sp.]|nr:VanW family protein [Kouleothrix sp.]
MHRPSMYFAAALLAATLAWPAAPAAAAPATAAPVGTGFAFFPETGHNVGLAIKRFYDSHGGLDIFGLPLTEVFEEDGARVQYFERARFELHPELPPEFLVSLTLLGRHFTEGRGEPSFQWIASNPGGDRTYFPESGHTLGGAFRGFWAGRGGLAAFGYPISEEFGEVNPQDGQFYTVQYFERARFELHPENSGTPYEVQLGQLGRQFLSERPAAQAQTGPSQPLTLIGKAITGFRTSATERRENIARATAMFDGVVVQPGQEYSFLSAGDFSENNGFVEGYAIVAGKLEKVVGGGLCQVSTTMFRAVSNAGLDITDRAGHSFVVYFYENILGFDATVFTPYRDFKWRNDSPGPVTMAASADLDASTVTFELWGTSDGRTVSYEGPFTRNVAQPGVATWQYDRELPSGRTKQLVHGRAGMDVNLIRTVTMPDGSVKHSDNFFTHYQPWNDFYTYGAGVQPPAGVQVIDPRVIYSAPAPRHSRIYDGETEPRER